MLTVCKEVMGKREGLEEAEYHGIPRVFVPRAVLRQRQHSSEDTQNCTFVKQHPLISK